MRFAFAIFILASAASQGSSFAPTPAATQTPISSSRQTNAAATTFISSRTSQPALYSTLEEQEVLLEQQQPMGVQVVSVQEEAAEEEEQKVVEVTAEAINARLEKQMEKMRLKDQTSKQLTIEVRLMM